MTMEGGISPCISSRRSTSSTKTQLDAPSLLIRAAVAALLLGALVLLLLLQLLKPCFSNLDRRLGHIRTPLDCGTM